MLLLHEEKVAMIIATLDTLQPYITSHGGSITFDRYENEIVFIKLEGTCVSCPLSFFTITHGIERQLKAKIPEIKKVEVVEEA